MPRARIVGMSARSVVHPRGRKCAPSLTVGDELSSPMAANIGCGTLTSLLKCQQILPVAPSTRTVTEPEAGFGGDESPRPVRVTLKVRCGEREPTRAWRAVVVCAGCTPVAPAPGVVGVVGVVALVLEPHAATASVTRAKGSETRVRRRRVFIAGNTTVCATSGVYLCVSRCPGRA
jgi:hypothetical protein